ncbi:unnamed protein product [Lathyrus sativus]|nr:unnamed protein product [Lathyrus sativus]
MLIGIPCYHTISCMHSRSLNPSDYIPACYRKEAYQACYQYFIYPTNGKNLWEHTPYPDILPPPSKRAPGRPKRIRNKEADEKRKDAKNVSRNGMPNKFSICGMSGHNKTSCPAKPKQAQTATIVQTDQSQTV